LTSGEYIQHVLYYLFLCTELSLCTNKMTNTDQKESIYVTDGLIDQSEQGYARRVGVTSAKTP